MLAVIIPAYNRVNLLAEALDSLVAQTKKRFITVIVDDNSEENLQEVIDKYKQRLHLVYLKQTSNQGPGAARNRGLRWCIENNIELVMFLDSDDLLMPKAIERLSKEINITNNNIIISEIQSETKDKIPYIVENSETVWTHGKIYRVSFLQQNSIFFPEFRTNEDLGFNIVAFFTALAKNSISFLKEEHYLWRYHEDSITRTEKNKEEKIIQLAKDFLKAMYFSYENFLRLNLDLNRIAPKIVKGLYFYSSYLKSLKSFGIEDEEIVRKLYSNNLIKESIIREFEKADNGFFADVPQFVFYSEEKFILRQNIFDFIEEYSDIKIQGEKW